MKLLTDSILERVEFHPDTMAVCWREDSTLRQVTWNQVLNATGTLIQKLQSVGLTAGDRFAQISENRVEWLIVDLACQFMRLVHVPLSPRTSVKQNLELLHHCEPSGLIVTSETQAILSELSIQEMQFHSVLGPSSRECSWFNTDIDEPQRLDFRLLSDAIMPDDLMTILYTSGTSGAPKGVMLSYRNTAACAEAINKRLPFSPQDLRLNTLPFSHIYARNNDWYVAATTGSPIAISDPTLSITENCHFFKPNFFNGVPRQFEKIRLEFEEAEFEEANRQKRSLKEFLGGAVLFVNSGGAKLDADTFEFFKGNGVPLLSGYGLTETSPVVATDSFTDFRCGFVGKPIDGLKLRLNSENVIEVNGPTVMLGYYKDPERTLEVLKDGWFNTGDIGAVDDAGRLAIVGRKREMIVLSTGLNVFPEKVESALNKSQLISESCVFGEGAKHISALIVPSELAKKRFNLGKDVCSSELLTTIRNAAFEATKAIIAS